MEVATDGRTIAGGQAATPGQAQWDRATRRALEQQAAWERLKQEAKCTTPCYIYYLCLFTAFFFCLFGCGKTCMPGMTRITRLVMLGAGILVGIIAICFVYSKRGDIKEVLTQKRERQYEESRRRVYAETYRDNSDDESGDDSDYSGTDLEEDEEERNRKRNEIVSNSPQKYTLPPVQVKSSPKAQLETAVN